MLNILWEDSVLLVLNKPAGLPAQPGKTPGESLLSLASAHTRGELWMVHRLDQPVSGVIVLAKTKMAAQRLSEQFRSRDTEKRYLAFVSPAPDPPAGTLLHFFEKKERQNKSIACLTPSSQRDEARLDYVTLGATERYALLEIRLHTGRHHQIRAQLSAAGWPVKGDVKYGARRSNPDRSIHLHAWRLTFRHPHTQAVLQAEAPLPEGDALWAAGSKMLKTLEQ